jgi:hypothetical protein
MHKTNSLMVVNRLIVGVATILIVASSGTSIVVAPVRGDDDPGQYRLVGDFQPSDLGFPPKPTKSIQITHAIFGRDLCFAFTQPVGNDAVHIRWSGPGHSPDQQEDYATGGFSNEFVEYYTIHHVQPGQNFMFQFQRVIWGHIPSFPPEKDTCGPWVRITVQVPVPKPNRPPAPLPAPPPAPPPPTATTPSPSPPKTVFASRQNKTDVHIYWSGAQHADWYTVERRLAVSARAEGPGSTSWATVSGKLSAGRGQFIAHFPSPPGQLKNIFRVTSYNSKGHTSSVAVAETALRIARTVQPSPSGPKIPHEPRPSPSHPSVNKVTPRAANLIPPAAGASAPLK